MNATEIWSKRIPLARNFVNSDIKDNGILKRDARAGKTKNILTNKNESVPFSDMAE